MTSDPGRLESLYQQGTARGMRPRPNCPPEETLARAAAGEMDPAGREQLVEHMIVCSDCAQEYRVVRSLRSWAEEAAAGGPGWTPPLVLGEARPPLTVHWWESVDEALRPGITYAIAAALAVMALGLGVWVAMLLRETRQLGSDLHSARGQGGQMLQEQRAALDGARLRLDALALETAELRRKMQELAQPQLNTPIFDLEPRVGTRSGSGPGVKSLSIPRGVDVFTLVLNVAGQASFPEYALEIQEPKGGTIWRGSRLQKTPYNTFLVSLTRQSLPAGQYRLLVKGLNNGREATVEQYDVLVAYQ